MPSNGKFALVTGAGSGIGRAVALALQREGYSVALAGRRLSQLENTANEASMEGGDVFVAVSDVTSPADVRSLFQDVEDRFGRLDLLFNNAGISGPSVPLDEITYEDWLSVINVNLNGAFLCAQAAFRTMKNQEPRGGRIINNGSIAAYVPRPQAPAYAASKHGITALTKSISLEGRAFDIACSQIDIGNAATEMTEPMSAGALQANGSRMREPRINLQHVADAVVYMAGLPLEANVQFMTLMATKMPYIGRG